MGDRWKTAEQAKGSKFQSEHLWNFSRKCCSFSFSVYERWRQYQMGQLLYWCKLAYVSWCSWRYWSLYQLQRCFNAYTNMYAGLFYRLASFLVSGVNLPLWYTPCLNVSRKSFVWFLLYNISWTFQPIKNKK